MNFYLDFEATQFSNQIISIGCVSENGDTFSTFVNPKEKVSTFITELTGITNDTLSAAPGPDEAFERLHQFVVQCDSISEPHYFCYGDGDKKFIVSSIKHMQNIESIIFAQSILYALFDYAQTVKKFFNIEQSIALRKLFSFISKQEIVQHHDALEDAIMLHTVATMINFCHPEDLEKINQIPGQQKPQLNKNKKKAPLSFLKLEGSTWKSNTGDAASYTIKCYGRGNHIKYFDDFEIAVMWIIKYFAGGSPKDKRNIKQKEKQLQKAIKNHTKYYGLYWESKDENNT